MLTSNLVITSNCEAFVDAELITFVSVIFYNHCLTVCPDTILYVDKNKLELRFYEPEENEDKISGVKTAFRKILTSAYGKKVLVENEK